MKKKVKRGFLDYLTVYLGCAIQAFAVTCILKPNGLVVGGFTGVSLVLGKLVNIKYTFIYYTLCISVLILTWFLLGKKEVLKILLLSTTYPLILILFDNISFNFIEYSSNGILLSCIYYGIFSGIGTGLILKKGFSQGSSDTVAKILNKKLLPFMSISQILLIIDILILALSAFVFGKNAVLYAIVMEMIYTKVMESVLFGFGSSLVKMVVISEKTDDIAEFILKELGRSVSIGTITGAYSNVNKRKVILICSTKESMLVKNFAAKIDKNAFINLVPVIFAWGKGDGFDNLEIE